VRLWRLARPRPGIIMGMAGGIMPVTGLLPEAGGTLDQSAWLMDAFDILDAAYLELKPNPAS
jgi:hypothetical protein